MIGPNGTGSGVFSICYYYLYYYIARPNRERVTMLSSRATTTYLQVLPACCDGVLREGGGSVAYNVL